MSIRAQDEAKAILARKRAFERDRANQRLERQIGSSFVLGTKPEIELLLDWCIVEKPAQIRSVSFRKSGIRLEIDWPFRLREPTNDPDTFFPSARSVRRFAEDLRIHFLEQRRGAKFANLMRNEFEEFLPKLFRAQRFEKFPGSKDSIDTVRDVLSRIGKNTRGTRLAGPHKAVIPVKRAEQIKREGCSILKTLLRLRRRLLSHTETGIGDRVFLETILSEYDTDQYPWMNYFRRCFRRLKPSRYSSERRPSIDKPSSWSAKDLTVLILREKYLHEKGAEYPPSAISRLLKCTRQKS
jgi:hypothetical protein